MIDEDGNTNVYGGGVMLKERYLRKWRCIMVRQICDFLIFDGSM